MKLLPEITPGHLHRCPVCNGTTPMALREPGENIRQGRHIVRVLAAFVSRKGSTAEIARAVGKELLAAGKEADVREMVSVASLAGYDAVVIGGPMYMGRMDGAVRKFVRRHQDALMRLPVAGFIVGLTPVSGDPAGMEMAQKALRSALLPLHPVAEAVFAGRLDPAGLSWFQNWITKKAKSPVGDFRNWDAIAVWARELPAKTGL